MVNSIIKGSGQQTPPSKAFASGQAPDNPLNTPKVKQAPQAVNRQDATLQPGKTEEIGDKLALSRDKSRISPNQVFNNSLQRGSILNITV